MVVQLSSVVTDCLPSSNEHVQVLCGGLYGNGGQNNSGANPNGVSATDTIGEIWCKWICGEGSDILSHNVSRSRKNSD